MPRITARDHLHPQWYIPFLHTKHHITFRAAALILICLSFIFSALVGDFTGAIATPCTLKTVFAKFDIKDNFVVHPRVFPGQIKTRIIVGKTQTPRQTSTVLILRGPKNGSLIWLLPFNCCLLVFANSLSDRAWFRLLSPGALKR
ncbi:hypothetical protein B0H14DRAFT_2829659 [Mycena olivaceomarginata]|nr:hypothetical protein B0H14DRAFT_2829659 [Mycena olivaceomarginata]